MSLRGTISFPVLLLKRVHLEVRELKSDTHLVRTPDLLLDSIHCSLFSGVQIKRKTDSNIPLHCCSYVIHTSVFRLTARYDTRKEPVQSCLPLGKGILWIQFRRKLVENTIGWVYLGTWNWSTSFKILCESEVLDEGLMSRKNSAGWKTLKNWSYFTVSFLRTVIRVVTQRFSLTNLWGKRCVTTLKLLRRT